MALAPEPLVPYDDDSIKVLMDSAKEDPKTSELIRLSREETRTTPGRRDDLAQFDKWRRIIKGD
jgi:hypothetical protein